MIIPIEPKCCSISASEVFVDMPETKIVSSWTMKSPLRSLGGPPLPKKKNSKLTNDKILKCLIEKKKKPRHSDTSVNHENMKFENIFYKKKLVNFGQ